MHYLMYPAIFTHKTYIGKDKVLIGEKYFSLFDALVFAKETGVCLREQNWFIYQCSFFTKKRLSLKSLCEAGYFAKEISEDEISIYYNWK